MTEVSNSITELELLKGSVTYKCVKESNGQFTVTVDVDADLHFGYGFSLAAAKNDAATNALQRIKTMQDESDNRSAFYLLKEKRKGLNFQSIRKSKGLFDVFVQVDFVKYFGRGETQPKANNDCSANVLAAFDSGQHERSIQALPRNAFNTLKKMRQSLIYRTISSSEDKYEVNVNVDGIDYFGAGQTIPEANNDSAWEALKSIWSGDHKTQIDAMDDYWYDENYLSSIPSSEHLLCSCICHSCNCCFVHST